MFFIVLDILLYRYIFFLQSALKFSFIVFKLVFIYKHLYRHFYKLHDTIFMFICTGWHFAIAVVGILEYFKTKCFVHESKKENP